MEHVWQLDPNPAHVGSCAHEDHSVGVALLRDPPRALDYVADPFGLGLEGIPSGKLHLSSNSNGALQLPIRLPHYQHVVVWLHCHLWVWSRGRGKTGRSQILSIGSPLEDVARVQWYAERRGGDAAGAIGRKSRDFGGVKVRALVEPAREEHQIANRHPFPVRELSALSHGAIYRDVSCRPELGDREHANVVVLPELKIVNYDAGGVAERGTQLNVRRVWHRPRDQNLSKIDVGAYSSSELERV